MSTVAPPAPKTRADSLGYHAPLDGLRGLALLAIIVYHSGLTWAPGAFLSVSTFFTLSGFLITALMLAEFERNDGVSLRGFWGRRLRRLMPAALVAISLIVVLSIWLADATQWVRLRADALSAVVYVANWRFVLAGDSYGANFDSPSPFTHFWTLAIEEQFYIVLPLLVIGALVASKGSRRTVALTLGGIAVAALIWSNWLVSSGASIDRLYFGTDVRSVELLSGALLALWWMRRPDPLSERSQRVIAVLSPLAILTMLGLWVTADLQVRAFYRGGLALYSVLTLIAIVGALQPEGILHRVLSWRPLVWVGLVSYAAYLLHYPVLLWLRQHTGLGVYPRILLAMMLTFGLAALSGRYIERPIRSGRSGLSPERIAAVAGAAVLVTVGLVVALTTFVHPVDRADLDAAVAWQKYLQQTAAQQRSDAPRVAIYGDSTALMTNRGVSERSRQNPDAYVDVGGWANLGCGLMITGNRLVRGEERRPDEICLDWVDQWAATSAAEPADVAVVQLGPWEVLDQQIVPGGPFLTIGEDPELDAALADRLRLGIDTLLEHNGMVVILAPPDVEIGRVDGRSPETSYPESDPARMARFREIIDEVADGDDRVRVLALDEWLDAQPDDARLRPDGVHFTDTSTLDVASWLGPQLVRLYTERTGEIRSTVPRT